MPHAIWFWEKVKDFPDEVNSLRSADAETKGGQDQFGVGRRVLIHVASALAPLTSRGKKGSGAEPSYFPMVVVKDSAPSWSGHSRVSAFLGTHP